MGLCESLLCMTSVTKNNIFKLDREHFIYHVDGNEASLYFYDDCIKKQCYDILSQLKCRAYIYHYNNIIYMIKYNNKVYTSNILW